MAEELKDLMDRLMQIRDEVRLQIHLGTADLKDEWDTLEERWDELEAQAADIKNETLDAAEDLKQGASVVAEELSLAYRRIRERL